MNFSYEYKGKTIFYKGYVFDSTIELKYALSIENTHAWLRNGIEIYYGMNVQPSGIKTNLHCYRPDFLVRNLTTYQAELIEIKPDGFTKEMQQKRAKTAARFIKRFAYDWLFRVITESEIILSPGQWLLCKEILGSKNDWHHQPCIRLLQNNTPLTDPQYEQFVKTGLLPAYVL
jgi:hypothetical protein